MAEPMLRNYLKLALRNLSRQKVFSFINIAGLAIGLACSMIILLCAARVNPVRSLREE